jgi:hypothetical protein
MLTLSKQNLAITTIVTTQAPFSQKLVEKPAYFNSMYDI